MYTSIVILLAGGVGYVLYLIIKALIKYTKN